MDNTEAQETIIPNGLALFRTNQAATTNEVNGQDNGLHPTLHSIDESGIADDSQPSFFFSRRFLYSFSRVSRDCSALT
jgi:hypothetical protein